MSMRSRPQRRYDWEGMNMEWGRQALTAIIDNLPEPEWSTDVHVHWQILEDSIHKGLAEYFPPKRALKRIDISRKQPNEPYKIGSMQRKSLRHMTTSKQRGNSVLHIQSLERWYKSDTC